MSVDPRPGRYTIRRRIAVGGMGEVYEADATGLGGLSKRVAVKLLRAQYGHSDERTRLFIEEAKLVFGLSHANVVHTYDVGLLDDHYFIAMEYVDGVDLRSLLRFQRERHGRGLAVEPAVAIAIEALKGLDYAHRAKDAAGLTLGVVHQDISPSNILLSTEGEVKLADFGVAIRAFRNDPGKYQVRGKYPYMAPEQVLGKGVDQRADVFATGAVLHEALVGERAFGPRGPMDAEDCEAARRRIENADGVPAELAAVVARALQHDRGKRYRRAADMREALESFAHDAGVRFSTSRLAELVKRAKRVTAEEASSGSGGFEGTEIARDDDTSVISQFLSAHVKVDADRPRSRSSDSHARPKHAVRRVPMASLDNAILVDETRWPVVIISGAEPAPISVAAANELHVIMDELFSRRQRFAIILDGRGMGMPDAKARRALADFAKSREHLFARFIVADATVFESAPLRGVVTAINWMAPPKHPVRAFGDLESAVSWATELLAAEGLIIT